MGLSRMGRVVDLWFWVVWGRNWWSTIFTRKQPWLYYSLIFLLPPFIFLYSLTISLFLSISPLLLISSFVFSFPLQLFMCLDSPPSFFYIWCVVCIYVRLFLSLRYMLYVYIFFVNKKWTHLWGIFYLCQ